MSGGVVDELRGWPTQERGRASARTLLGHAPLALEDGCLEARSFPAAAQSRTDGYGLAARDGAARDVHPGVKLAGQRFRAKVIDDESERARLWQLADQVVPPYSTDRERAAHAGRASPIVQLTRP
jgi:hypothetical protein